MTTYQNSYKCPCGEEWQDTWDCGACNDKCPKCNREIEPYESEALPKSPMRDEDYDGNDEQIDDLKELVTELAAVVKLASEFMENIEGNDKLTEYEQKILDASRTALAKMQS